MWCRLPQTALGSVLFRHHLVLILITLILGRRYGHAAGLLHPFFFFWHGSEPICLGFETPG